MSCRIYLWHYPVLAAVFRYGDGWNVWLRVLVAWSVTAACAAASWRLVERPAMRWRTRLPRSVTVPLEPSFGVVADPLTVSLAGPAVEPATDSTPG